MFKGKIGWDERMEHVGRHLARGDKEEAEDIELRQWLIEEELLYWDKVNEQWRIQGATHYPNP